ncbi:hypothetical protein [Amycolatopsis sp. lyj-23]|uniref:hypothetical protein n=1 Tax=Amycolatopsis sp. lyj-23 TaxID=2789283 RepID=UPI00397CDF87
MLIVVTAVVVMTASGMAPSAAIALVGAAGLLSAELATRLLGPAPPASTAHESVDASEAERA